MKGSKKKKKRKTLFLIDGNSFLYRGFYAIKDLRTSEGRPTNAIYGFISMIKKILRDEEPDYLAIAFDLKGPTFRHKKYKDYKVHRKPMPEDLVSQIPVVKDVIKAMGIPIYEMQGYEADDILATIARKTAGEDIEVFIATGDKDCLQLVDDNIKVYSTHKEGLIYDKEKVRSRYGVLPEMIPDLLSLMGDSSDNISGIRGIGEKTALKLLKEFGGLDKILAGADSIKPNSVRETVYRGREDARFSRELATLDDRVPIDFSMDGLKVGEPDSKRLRELFRELEFSAFLREHSGTVSLDSIYRTITEESDFVNLLKELSSQKLFVFDFETTGPDPLAAIPIGISFSYRIGEAFYVVLEGSKGGGLELNNVIQALKPIFENPSIRKAGQNIKYEYIILDRQGVSLKGVAFDTMVASYLINPSKFNHNLDDIALEYLNYKTTSIEELIGKGTKASTLAEVDVKEVSDYSCEDADVTFRLYRKFDKLLAEMGLQKLFTEIEMPLVTVLAKMEINGVSLDEDFLKAMSNDIGARIEGLCGNIYECAGRNFNINSPKQLQEVLFGHLKLPVIKKTKTGFSTNEAVLNKLIGAHPIVELILEYRSLAKLVSTYIDALPSMVNTGTGRLHTSFNQTVTATGRLSSSSPNLQNIPVRTELGREIRKAFVTCHNGNIIMSADYSQIELRILAHLSKDENLMEAFKGGHDIHSFTASLIFGIDEKDITKEMRSQAKTVNFGIIYGMSPYGLALDLGMAVKDAADFIENYFQRYPKVKDYLESLIEEARKSGFVKTITGRRRYITEINSSDTNTRQFAERTAINTPIQGSAADLIKAAMIAIDAEFARLSIDSKMILQVHDELVFDVRGTEEDIVRETVRKNMEEVFDLRVPIKVHIGTGENWFEAGS